MSDIRKHDSALYFRYKKKPRSENVFKFLSMLILIPVLVFSSFDVFSASCERLFYTDPGSDTTQPYRAYYIETEFTAEECPYSIVMDKEEFFKYNFFAEQFGDVDPISAGSIAESFTWGFGTYIGFWFLAFVIRTAKQTIKMV